MWLVHARRKTLSVWCEPPQSDSDLTTIVLTAVPIEEAFRRILRDKDFVLTYAGGRIVEVRIYGALESGGA